jgi:1,4-alpha-glucan branching enzyme
MALRGAKGVPSGSTAARKAGEPVGSVLFVLHSHLPWVLGHGAWPHGETWLYEAATECYLPLLTMLDRLSADVPAARLAVGITPVLAESLGSPRFQDGLLAYLDERASVADRDGDAFHAAGDSAAESLAQSWSGFFRSARGDFETRYSRDILAGFRRLQDAGAIEVLTSAATHGYLPLVGRDESVDAQVGCGVASYRRRFGRPPRGIWLPECAYRPSGPWERPTGRPRSWTRPGIEEVLSRHGLRYFFVDTHLVAGGVPLGTYEDRFEEKRLDATTPVRSSSPNEAYAVLGRRGRAPVAVFARDPRSSVQVWSADYGYPGDGAYLEFHRKKAPGGLRYWRITDRRLPLEAKLPYDPQAARARAHAHAEHFVGLVRETLLDHRARTGRPGVVVAPFDTELFGHWWYEGLEWLELVLRKLQPEVLMETPSEHLERHPPRSAITLPEGSWGQGGHHWVWLNDDTRWVWDLVYRAEDAFLDALGAAGPRPNAELSRVLRQLARELLLLESSDWPFLITTVAARDYAQARARSHFEAFQQLLEMARRSHGGALAPADLASLAELEARDGPFPEIELGWWGGNEGRQ